MSVIKRSSVYFEGEASCNNGSEDEDEVNDDSAGSLNDFIVEDEGDSTDQSSESESIAPVVSKKRGRPKTAKPVSTKKIIKEVTEEKLIGHIQCALTHVHLHLRKCCY